MIRGPSRDVYRSGTLPSPRLDLVGGLHAVHDVVGHKLHELCLDSVLILVANGILDQAGPEYEESVNQILLMKFELNLSLDLIWKLEGSAVSTIMFQTSRLLVRSPRPRDTPLLKSLLMISSWELQVDWVDQNKLCRVTQWNDEILLLTYVWDVPPSCLGSG